jgi:SAM-dependent methyltransferase
MKQFFAPTRAVIPDPIECKICQGSSRLFGVVDFHKSCIEAQGIRLPLSGYPVYYHRCERCAFTFTEAFDTWTHADFQQNIYNSDYVTVDPDYISARPISAAKEVAEAFSTSRTSMSILDYGGGTGLFAQRMRELQFSATTYDPFSSFNAMPAERFDLITCLEVMEHIPFPKETVQTMLSLLDKNGAILFSTLLQPESFEKTGLNWWYASPRNGHVSLYSSQSLALLFKPYGFRVASFSESTHIAYAQAPSCAAHLKLPR